MKLYKSLKLSGNAILDGENVLFAYRDNKMKMYQNTDLNERDIIGLPLINGRYQGDIIADIIL